MQLCGDAFRTVSSVGERLSSCVLWWTLNPEKPYHFDLDYRANQPQISNVLKLYKPTSPAPQKATTLKS